MLFALSFLVVFLLLVALYESWSIPASAMLIVPLGALSMANDIYFKVGLITIIGFSAKNAILIVEFAKDQVALGRPLLAAAIEGAKLRFRPILMTSMVFILGVIPLADATGASATNQRAIGTGAIGGILTATMLSVLFVPIFFVWVMLLFGKRKTATLTQRAKNDHTAQTMKMLKP